MPSIPGTPVVTIAPFPIFRVRAQPCLHRVPVDVFDDFYEVIFVANEPVKVVLMPELPIAFQHLVSMASSVRLPGVYDARQRVVAKRCRQHVDMIGHDHPCMQMIQVAIEVLKGITHQCGDGRQAQPAGAMALIQRLVDPSTILVFRSLKSIQVTLPLSEQMLRQAVRQSKTNVLGNFPGFKVRKTGAVKST